MIEQVVFEVRISAK